MLCERVPAFNVYVGNYSLNQLRSVTSIPSNVSSYLRAIRGSQVQDQNEQDENISPILNARQKAFVSINVLVYTITSSPVDENLLGPDGVRLPVLPARICLSTIAEQR